MSSDERRRIKNDLIGNFELLKEVFHYLQGHSPDEYPYIDILTIKRLLIKRIGLDKLDKSTKDALYDICLDVCRVNNKARSGAIFWRVLRF